MVALVNLVLVVPRLTHEFLLERKVSRYPSVNLPKAFAESFPGLARADCTVRAVYKIDQLAMLVVDRWDTQRELFVPLNQRHTFTGTEIHPVLV